MCFTLCCHPSPVTAYSLHSSHTNVLMNLSDSLNHLRSPLKNETILLLHQHKVFRFHILTAMVISLNDMWSVFSRPKTAKQATFQSLTVDYVGNNTLDIRDLFKGQRYFKLQLELFGEQYPPVKVRLMVKISRRFGP